MLVEIMKVNKGDVTVVTSLDVAEDFGKEHYHVIEDIREIQKKISNHDFSGPLYKGEYKDSSGKKNPMYYMNRDGFTLLVTGYSGEKAMKFKLAYIRQLNAEMLVGSLMEYGWGYDEIKDFILNKLIARLAA